MNDQTESTTCGSQNAVGDGNAVGTVKFYTLGCKVNQYETQMLEERFLQAGYQTDNSSDFADVYVINTCTVTNMADRKSRQHIRKYKAINPDAVIVVTGCYAQTEPSAAAGIDGVCIVAGTNEKHNIVDYVTEYIRENGKARKNVETHIIPYEELRVYEETGNVIHNDARTRAYIKVQEGCDRFCSYCIIPYARGRVRSRSEENIISEAEALLDRGFKEIVLTGINTALYGVDLNYMDGGKEECSGIERLIADINALEGDFRIRLSSLEPNVVDVKTVKALSKYEKLCHHMHLSVQSGSDSVLKRMKRRYTSEQYLEIVREMKKTDPMYAVTTDIIVGFPGETEEEFDDSRAVVRKAGLSRVHVFQYSRRSGTEAAEMQNQIDGGVKRQRSEQLLRDAEECAKEFRIQNLGSVQRVLFETVEDMESCMLAGYSDNYIRVYCRTGGVEQYINEFAQVRLEKLYKDGILGSIISF